MQGQPIVDNDGAAGGASRNLQEMRKCAGAKQRICAGKHAVLVERRSEDTVQGGCRLQEPTAVTREGIIEGIALSLRHSDFAILPLLDVPIDQPGVNPATIRPLVEDADKGQTDRKLNFLGRIARIIRQFPAPKFCRS